VLVPLRTPVAAGGLEVVFTVRRGDLPRHAGEISFPGGRREPADATLAETALREAEEEIGLERAHVELLGELSRVSTFATNYVIHPFVGAVAGELTWQPSHREVDAVLELSLDTLRSSKTRTRLERRGISFETDAYIVGEHVIWGATARILRELLERVRVAARGCRPSLVGSPSADPQGATWTVDS